MICTCNPTKHHKYFVDTSKRRSSPEWIKRRRISAYICIAYAFLIGLEYSSISISLLFYLTEDVGVDNPKKWYSGLMTALSLSASINGLLAGKFIDRTRRLRLCMLVFTAISICGNLLYTVHSSVWFLMIGRLLCGMCDAAQPVISGMRHNATFHRKKSTKDFFKFKQASKKVNLSKWLLLRSVCFTKNFKFDWLNSCDSIPFVLQNRLYSYSYGTSHIQ